MAARLTLAALALGTASGLREGTWVQPAGLEAGRHHDELLLSPAAGKQPHIVTILFDDYGWSEAGWHRNYTIGGVAVPSTREVVTPNLDALVREGIELDRMYAYKCCSPTRSAIQSGRAPMHVNPLNSAADISNRSDPVSGFAGIPRNMTGIAVKMAAAGYNTSMFGKWDVGMATHDHTPYGRGYHVGMTYFHHDNDYWSMAFQERCDREPVTDLWRKGPDAAAPEMPAFGYNSTCTGMQGTGARPAGCHPGPKGDLWHGGYEDSLLEQQVLEVIRRHDPARPLFLFWAPHIAHATYLDHFDFVAATDKPEHERQIYHAMVEFADAAVGNITAELKARQMYENTLIVFLSDNGGPISANGTAGANNYPLRGGKYDNWEGGIRVNSFVSGGFLPESQRATKYEGLITAWDLYATYCALGGVDPTDHRAAAAKLPPVDSLDHSALILGTNSTPPRREVLVGTEPALSNITTAPECNSYSLGAPLYDQPEYTLPRSGRCTTLAGIISDEEGGLWKLMTGDLKQNVTTGPHYPNSTTDFESQAVVGHCANGCLYELRSDPLEQRDVAGEHPDIIARLHKRLEESAGTGFNPHRGNTDPGACDAALNKWGGFWGPWIE